MRYEQLEVWQRSFQLCTEIYGVFRESRDYGFRDQICRSAVSVPSNIAEGFERESDKEKARFIVIAKGSIGELKTQVMLAERIGYIEPEFAGWLRAECEGISRMLGALNGTLRADMDG